MDHGPIGLAYDREYIWVAAQQRDTVDKVRASDGVLIGSYQSRARR